MEAIKACPCCGGEGKLKDIHTTIRQGWVGCPACGLYIQWKISPAGAIAKWNKRAEAPDSMIVALTPGAIALLKYMPEAVNALAATLTTKTNELILYGDSPKRLAGDDEDTSSAGFAGTFPSRGRLDGEAEP